MCTRLSSSVARMEQKTPVLHDKANSISLLQGKHRGLNLGILWSTSILTCDVSCQHTVLNGSLLTSSSETHGPFYWQVEFAVHGLYLALGNSTHRFSHLHPRLSSFKKNLESAVILTTGMHIFKRCYFVEEELQHRATVDRQSLQSSGSTIQRRRLFWKWSKRCPSLCPTDTTILTQSKGTINAKDTHKHVMYAEARTG